MTKKQYWEEIYSCMYSMWIKDFPQDLKDKVEQKVKEGYKKNARSSYNA